MKSYLNPKPEGHFKAILIAYLFLSIYLICLGTECIITQASPDSLGTITSLWDSFINSLPSHLILILGALTFTNAIWLLSNSKNKH